MYIIVYTDIYVYTCITRETYTHIRVYKRMSTGAALSAKNTGGVDDILGGDVSLDVTEGSEPPTPGTTFLKNAYAYIHTHTHPLYACTHTHTYCGYMHSHTHIHTVYTCSRLSVCLHIRRLCG